MNLEVLNKQLKLLDARKKPKQVSKHIGIEFEFISKYSYELVGLVASQLGLSKVLHLGSDGSIRSGKNEPYEARLLCKETELKYYLNKINKWFNKIQAYTNNSCGLHVHLDMRKRNFTESYKKLMAAQNLMFKVVPQHRKHNRYCKKQKAKDVSYIQTGGVPTPTRMYTNIYGQLVSDPYSGIYATRNAAINPTAYSKYKTIEIRIFEGTTNTDSVYKWCQFLIGLLNSDNIITEKTYLKVGSLPKDIKQYLTARIRKYGIKKTTTKNN